MRLLISLLLAQQLSQSIKVDHPRDISLIASQVDSPESLKKYEQLIKGHISRMNLELEKSDEYAKTVLNPQINKLLNNYGEKPQQMAEKHSKTNQTAAIAFNLTANTTKLVQKSKNLTKGTLHIIQKDSNKVEEKLKSIESKFLREDSSSAIPMETEDLSSKKDLKKPKPSELKKEKKKVVESKKEEKEDVEEDEKEEKKIKQKPEQKKQVTAQSVVEDKDQDKDEVKDESEVKEKKHKHHKKRKHHHKKHKHHHNKKDRDAEKQDLGVAEDNMEEQRPQKKADDFDLHQLAQKRLHEYRASIQIEE